jgi:acyl-CoA thioesterase YciA
MQLPTNCEPTLRIKTRPNDANKGGDIFGGWLMSQIDIASAIEAERRAKGPVVTVAVKNLTFLKPLFIYDIVSFYSKVTEVGKTSLTVETEVYAQRETAHGLEKDVIKISDATLVFVAVSKPGKPRPVPRE